MLSVVRDVCHVAQKGVEEPWERDDVAALKLCLPLFLSVRRSRKEMGSWVCSLKESSEKGEASTCAVYSEEGGRAAWTNKKGDAAAVIVPALADSGAAKDWLPCKILSCCTWILPGLLRPVPFLNFTMIQSNRAHAFLGCYTEADSTYSRSCTDKDMGIFGGGLWLVAWWGAWEVLLGVMRKENSELRCSERPQG